MLNWYKIHFGQQLEELYRLKEKASGKQLIKINQTIRIITLSIDELDLLQYQSRFQEEITLADKLWSEWDSRLGDSRYLQILEPLSEMPFLTEEKKNFYAPKLGDEELFEILREFFIKATDREIYGYFKRVFKKRNRYVHTDRLMEDGPVADTLYLPHYDRAHIRLKRQDAVEDFTGFSHEFGHALQFLLAFHPNILSSNYIFSEIVSIFFELLGYEYLRTCAPFQNKSRKNEKVVMNDFQNVAALELLEEALFDIYAHVDFNSRKGIKEFEEGYEKIVRGSEYEGISLEDTLDQRPINRVHYIISYIIAIEILMVYKSDKEKGLYLLKRIIGLDLKLGPDHYYKSISNEGIEPNAHLLDFWQHVEKGEKMQF